MSRSQNLQEQALEPGGEIGRINAKVSEKGTNRAFIMNEQYQRSLTTD
jgi:hypothetical protein